MADPRILKKIEENYKTVADIIRQYGKPNKAFPNDFDLDYGTLHKKAEKMQGLATVLKNMKRQKLVDFSDQGIFKENSMITLITGDWENEQAKPTQITYDEIATKVKGEVTSHQKVSYNSTSTSTSNDEE